MQPFDPNQPEAMHSNDYKVAVPPKRLDSTYKPAPKGKPKDSKKGSNTKRGGRK